MTSATLSPFLKARHRNNAETFAEQGLFNPKSKIENGEQDCCPTDAAALNSGGRQQRRAVALTNVRYRCPKRRVVVHTASGHIIRKRPTKGKPQPHQQPVEGDQVRHAVETGQQNWPSLLWSTHR